MKLKNFLRLLGCGLIAMVCICPLGLLQTRAEDNTTTTQYIDGQQIAEFDFNYGKEGTVTIPEGVHNVVIVHYSQGNVSLQEDCMIEKSDSVTEYKKIYGRVWNGGSSAWQKNYGVRVYLAVCDGTGGYLNYKNKNTGNYNAGDIHAYIINDYCSQSDCPVCPEVTPCPECTSCPEVTPCPECPSETACPTDPEGGSVDLTQVMARFDSVDNLITNNNETGETTNTLLVSLNIGVILSCFLLILFRVFKR